MPNYRKSFWWRHKKTIIAVGIFLMLGIAIGLTIVFVPPALPAVIAVAAKVGIKLGFLKAMSLPAASTITGAFVSAASALGTAFAKGAGWLRKKYRLWSKKSGHGVGKKHQNSKGSPQQKKGESPVSRPDLKISVSDSHLTKKNLVVGAASLAEKAKTPASLTFFVRPELATQGFVQTHSLYNDEHSCDYINRLRTIASQKQWLPEKPGFFKKACPNSVSAMRKLVSSKNLLLSDTDVISSFVEVAKEALAGEEKHNAIQQMLFQRIVGWETISDLESLRKDVEMFLRELQNDTIVLPGQLRF